MQENNELALQDYNSAYELLEGNNQKIRVQKLIHSLSKGGEDGRNSEKSEEISEF